MNQGARICLREYSPRRTPAVIGLNAVCDGCQRHTNGVSVPADYSSSLIRLSELRIGCTGYILQVRRRRGRRIFYERGTNA